MNELLSRRSALGAIGATGAIALTPVLTPAVFAKAADKLELRAPDGRTIAVSVWQAKRRRGTILFSHGALSAPWKYAPLTDAWVAAGYDVWAPLHVDSTDHPRTKDFPGLSSWPARIEDMRALAAHVGARRYVAAGHSYGALVALTLGGASPTPPKGILGPLSDPRVNAVVAFSPPGPGMGLIDLAGYATLAVPALIETGTGDLPPGASPAPDAWHGHLAAYDAGPADDRRYGLVLDGADHYFGGLICRPELPGPHQTAQLAEATAVSLLFLDGYGRGLAEARSALDARVTAGDGVGLHRR